jgi:hypothetical protein
MRRVNSGRRRRINTVACVVFILGLVALQSFVGCSTGDESKSEGSTAAPHGAGDRFGEAHFGEGRLQ